MSNSPLELLSYFSSMNAPVEYYMTFMFQKNRKDVYVLKSQEFLNVINEYLKKLTGKKKIISYDGPTAKNDYFNDLKESYKSNMGVYDNTVKTDVVKTYSWKFVNKDMIRIDEVKDGTWSILSLFINPKFPYESTVKILKDMSSELAKKFKVGIKLDTRIIGEDSIIASKVRTISCLNQHYRTNKKELTQFTEKNFIDFYFHYDCKDLEMRHKVLGDPLTKENITTKLDANYLNNISDQRKQMIISNRLPPITNLHSFSINELGWVEKSSNYMRPTPLIDFGMDWIGYTPIEGVNPSSMFKVYQEMFYEITRRDIYKDDEKQLNELRELLATQYANVVTVEDKQGKEDVEKDIIIYTERCSSNLEFINNNPIAFHRYFCRAE